MANILAIHPQNPQPRLIQQALAALQPGSVMVYPTDSSLAFGCRIGDKSAQERIQRLRQAGKDHNFTLVCRDLAEIATYARVDNVQYRLLRALTPGPFTFILEATREVPRRLQNPKRRTIGLRVPDHRIVAALLAQLGSEPIMSSTLILPGDDRPPTDFDDMVARIGSQVDLIIDGGPFSHEPTTVIDLVDGTPRLVRQGLGDASRYLE